MKPSDLKGLFRRAWLVARFQIEYWSQSKLNLATKISYTASSLGVLWTGRIRFLGDWFYSDNRAALLLLPEYVQLCNEVVSTISVTQKPRLKVLDVGANVGQFGATMSRMFDAEVVSLEPNPACWNFLELNGCNSPHWQLQRRGLAGKPAVLELFYVPNKSAQGSFSRSNATINLLGAVTPTSVHVEVGPYVDGDDSISPEFDLVKIDVEGYELEVLRGLRGVTTRYLLVEIDELRHNGFSEEQLISEIELSLSCSVTRVFSDRPASALGPRNVLYRLMPSIT